MTQQEDRTNSDGQGSGEVAHDREVERDEARTLDTDGLPEEASEDFTFPDEDARD